MGLPARVLTLFVRAYQVVLSPVMGGACRFEPTCSNYMIEALRVHGAVKGTTPIASAIAGSANAASASDTFGVLSAPFSE